MFFVLTTLACGAGDNEETSDDLGATTDMVAISDAMDSEETAGAGINQPVASAVKLRGVARPASMAYPVSLEEKSAPRCR